MCILISPSYIYSSFRDYQATHQFLGHSFLVENDTTRHSRDGFKNVGILPNTTNWSKKVSSGYFKQAFNLFNGVNFKILLLNILNPLVKKLDKADPVLDVMTFYDPLFNLLPTYRFKRTTLLNEAG